MAFSDLFKMWLGSKKPDSPKNAAFGLTIVDAPVPSPSGFPVPRSDFQIESFELTLRDAISGRSFTDTFFCGCTIPAALNRAKEEGILSVDDAHLWIFSQEGKKLSNSLNPATEPAVYPGATLIIDLRMIGDPQFQDPEMRQKLYKAYPLVFFRKENGSCIERIDFLCYGYEAPFYICKRMQEQNILNPYHLFSIPHWPTKVSPEYAYPGAQILCEFDPEPGRVFIIEEEDVPPPFLYGCPTAVLPSQIETLRYRQVDVISYE